MGFICARTKFAYAFSCIFSFTSVYSSLICCTLGQQLAKGLTQCCAKLQLGKIDIPRLVRVYPRSRASKATSNDTQMDNA